MCLRKTLDLQTLLYSLLHKICAKKVQTLNEKVGQTFQWNPKLESLTVSKCPTISAIKKKKRLINEQRVCLCMSFVLELSER